LPNFAAIGQTIAEIWHFSIFRMTAAAILYFENVEILGREGSRWPKCVTVPNFAQIGETVAEKWPFFYFSRWRPPPSWIFKIWKL